MGDEYFHGVAAPAWADDHTLAEILRQEANDERDWFGTDRDKALLLTAADCIDRLESELSLALRSIKDQEAMEVEIFDLRTDILNLVAQVQNRDAVLQAFDNDTYTTIEVEQARLVRLVAKYPELTMTLVDGGVLAQLRAVLTDRWWRRVTTPEPAIEFLDAVAGVTLDRLR